MRSTQRQRVIIVIPSRYGSTRFPGKPLAPIAGKTLLARVWSIAKAVPGIDEVYIATDDERIREHAASFGAQCVMTSPQCRNGTERAYEVVTKLNDQPEIIVNLQGDAVLTPPHIIEALVRAMQADASIKIATPAVRLSEEQRTVMQRAKEKAEASGTFVVFAQDHQALYFSKLPIPHLRKSGTAAPSYRHIGIYAYRASTLEKFVSLRPTPLEQAEQLEQLRALEHGLPIKVVEVDYGPRTAWSVDAPEDVLAVEAIIKREGELV